MNRAEKNHTLETRSLSHNRYRLLSLRYQKSDRLEALCKVTIALHYPKNNACY
ncbi:MAG: hypothetical protein HC847_00840 [Hydrococcus sp. RU_2_2]|nr:hypothetical protein [Hydrococcus sp. RU_2_2]